MSFANTIYLMYHRVNDLPRFQEDFLAIVWNHSVLYHATAPDIYIGV